jgi:thiamine pyrophosphate-dependent acetolactate synthase large subunit-like protein
MADSIPIVVICGQVPTAAIGSDAFPGSAGRQHHGLGRQARVPRHRRIEARSDAAHCVRDRAHRTPWTGRHRYPKDVQNWRGEFHGTGRLPVSGYRHRMNRLMRSVVADAQCAEFFAMLGEAQRPLIYAGGGVVRSDGAAALREFSLEFGVPVVTTLMGLGAFDTTHPLCMSMLGMHGAAFANYAVDDCDFLFTLGARFDDRVAGNPPKFAPNAKRIAQIDIDASEINKVKPVGWSHIGLLPEALRALLAYGRRSGFQTRLVCVACALWRAQALAPHELRSQQPADPAVPRHRRDQQADARRGDHLDRRRPAPDVGGAVLRLPRAAFVADVGQHGHDGLRLARRDRRAGGPSRQAGDRHRRRCEHPHESRRARKPLRPTSCR